ncbi:MAG: glycosyltransferase family A protein [bacterium]|nr:glycosyltransferase family A protein [bacterium]
METLVSVIIPAYNSEEYIGDAIRSVAEQSYTNLELIIVDDRSTDNTINIAMEIAEVCLPGKYAIYFRPLDHPRGPGAARNEALRRANGHYIAFLDSDDIWLPDHLQTAIDHLEEYKGEAGLYYCRMSLSGNNRSDGKHNSGWGKIGAPTHVTDILIKDACVHLPVVCVEKSLLLDAGGFEESLPNCQDWWLWLKLSKVTKFIYFNRPGALLRMHNDSVTRTLGGAKQVVGRVRTYIKAKQSGLFTEDELVALRESCFGIASSLTVDIIRKQHLEAVIYIVKSSWNDGAGCLPYWLYLLWRCLSTLFSHLSFHLRKLLAKD